MDHEIKRPVTDHGETHNHSVVRVSANGVVGGPDHQTPHGCAREAVRDGVVVEIERRHACDARRDAHMFESEQQQDRPDQIEKLGCEEQGPEGGAGGEPFGGESHSKMTDEHESTVARWSVQLRTAR